MDHSEHLASSNADSAFNWFSQTGFMPHMHCYLGKPELVWTMFTTDTTIGVAYLGISLILWGLVRKIQIPFSPVVLCFGIFIGACGLTHLMEVWTLWNPDYWASAGVKIVTAFASVGTGVYLYLLREPILTVATATKLAEKRHLDLEALSKDLERRVHERTAALEESERRFSATFEQAAAGMAQVGLEGQWLKVNKKYCEMLGYSEDELKQKTFKDITHPEDLAKDLSLSQALYEDRIQTYSIDKRYIRKDGSITWVNLTASIVRRSDGTPDYFIAVAVDINDRKRVEGDLIRLKDEAEKANQLKSAFLANMSHEIRTPLGAMLGFADLLKEPDLTMEDRSNFTEILTRNGEQLSVIINDILDLSKVEAGHMSFHYTAMDPLKVTQEVLALFQVKAHAKNLNLQLGAYQVGGLPFVTDVTRVRQILMNLIGNAIKFTEKGSVQVSVFEEHKKNLERELVFEVKDTGIGIPRDQWNNIFDVFVQVDGSTTRRFGGTGLGLALSRRLAQELGGNVVVSESTVNQGSTFRFTVTHRTLPADRPSQPNH